MRAHADYGNITMIVSILLGLLTGARWLRVGFAAPLGYLAIVVGGSAAAGPMPVRVRAWLPVVLAATHLSWGTGFLVGRPRSRP